MSSSRMERTVPSTASRAQDCTARADSLILRIRHPQVIERQREMPAEVAERPSHQRRLRPQIVEDAAPTPP